MIIRKGRDRMELLYGVVPGILQLGFGNKSKDNLGSGIHSSTRPTMCDVCDGTGEGGGLPRVPLRSSNR